jgi:hypothetical protein
MKLTKEQILGIIRHALTFGGGILITLGLFSEGIVTEISGLIIALVGGVWSIVEKK